MERTGENRNVYGVLVTELAGWGPLDIAITDERIILKWVLKRNYMGWRTLDSSGSAYGRVARCNEQGKVFPYYQRNSYRLKNSAPRRQMSHKAWQDTNSELCGRKQFLNLTYCRFRQEWLTCKQSDRAGGGTRGERARWTGSNTM